MTTPTDEPHQNGKLHAGEPDIDVPLVRKLLAAQFPQWAHLPVEQFPSAGTVNAVFRLGDAMAVRLPRIAGGAEDVAKESHWLPWLAPQLPATIPAVLGRGEPGEGYPWTWSVHSWLDGENPAAGALTDPVALAADLAAFITALRRADATDGPPAYRGAPVATEDAETRAAIEKLRRMGRTGHAGQTGQTGQAGQATQTKPNGTDAPLDLDASPAPSLSPVDTRIDLDAATAAWEATLRTPDWHAPPVWVHSDLMPGNLLVRDGRLHAVIDFGTAGVGDPACDLIVAWNLLPADARDAFRVATGADDAMWARGRGRALSMALIQLPYYAVTNPVLAANARHVIHEVLADHARGD
ncbi:aminoglycoside phosphotransferase family protein [Streptomyces flavofungini]|uniref:Aminoglycoside phosphotransferase family protein n=1 Tax=Streptomyces flavofungini TaxID=68200 RepID=A0ABS0XA52_9ACTN|nr:aminoglycoside phosphotransferase family protein [Streptomyces flavofungini]MBJ3810080.1 aminoglycoside phosphotransferase family protein [Streptomyces flavofungini]GHC81457.1 phosphotransferase [Streptomyces flavofungini]